MNPYTANRENQVQMHRLVVDIEQELLQKIDAWAVPTGLKSRSEAVRSLLRSSLEAVSEK